MNKTLVALSLLLVQSTFASTMNEESYLDAYATELVHQFDKSLDSALITGQNPLDSEVYAKLLVIRDKLDHHDRDRDHEKVALPLFNSLVYESVKNTVNREAKVLHNMRSEVYDAYEKQSEVNPPYAYPSTTAKGNVFGTDFPKNVWALSYDDGPRNVKTAKIIDNLLARNIKATFFMLTESAKAFPNAAKDARDRGMDIALHSYTHANLPKVSAATLKHEIVDAKIDLEKLLGIDLKLFRLPYGAGVHTDRIRKLIAENGMINVFWNIDTLDWQDKKPTSVLARAKKLMSATPNHSGIILFHDIHETSREASRLVIDYLLSISNKICSVQEVIDGLNGESQQCY